MKFLGLSYCVSAKKMREGIFVFFVFLRLEGKRKVGTYRIRPRIAYVHRQGHGYRVSVSCAAAA